MPDLSDTVAKCRMGTAKKFYTSIASLSHTNKSAGHGTEEGKRVKRHKIIHQEKPPCKEKYYSASIAT